MVGTSILGSWNSHWLNTEINHQNPEIQKHLEEILDFSSIYHGSKQIYPSVALET